MITRNQCTRTESILCAQYDKRFQKKLAHDTESANVLVAACDFLDGPVVVASAEQSLVSSITLGCT